VAELDRAFIIERTQTGYKSYRAAGRVGNSRHSKSGKDLPVGRPKKVFRRDEAVKLRAGGMSLRAIALRLNVPFSTIRRSVEGVPK
jgi:DNA invertase Pin-like site-specific DNA recombinase